MSFPEKHSQASSTPAADNAAPRSKRDAGSSLTEKDRAKIAALSYVNPEPPPHAGYRSILVTHAPPPRLHEIERYKIGERIGGRYEVMAIHRGGMGVVYGAFDHEERLPRALKTLQLRFAVNASMRDLFAQEATLWVRLEKHPFIVRAFIVQQYDGQPFVITEYIRGPEGMGSDLRAWLGHPKLTLPVAVEMALQIAQGMQQATRTVPGLIHRDLKPANVLVDDRGRALVTDFGLACAAEAGAGTPAYMSPEQWRGGHLDQRTDIYSFGCILYEMFTGHRLFAAGSLEEWRTAHLRETPVPIWCLAEVPEGLEDFVFRCLSKDAAARPANWDEVVNVCAHWFHLLTGQPVVTDFSAYELTVSELVGASHSLGQLERYPEMLEICERLLARSPEYREGLINKIAALYKLNRLQEALATIEQVLAANPKDALALDSKCVVLGALGRHDEALAAVEQALAIDPAKSHAWTTKGRTLQKMDRHEEALAAFDRALALDRADVETWISKLGSLDSLRRSDELLSTANLVSAVSPVDERPWIFRGRACLHSGRADAALSYYERALALNPKSSSAHTGKCFTLIKLNRLDGALEAADRGIAANPGDREVWQQKLYVLKKLERWEEALRVAEEALRLDPRHAQAWGAKGDALEKLGRREEALAAYREAVALHPADPENWLFQNHALETLGRWEELLSAADEAAAMYPENEVFWRQKGLAAFRLERLEDALAAYEHALSLNPSRQACFGALSVLLKLERWEDALRASDRAAAAVPNARMYAFQQKIYTLARLQRWPEVIAVAETALATGAGGEQGGYFSYYKAVALDSLGRLEEAVTAYGEALAFDPRHYDAVISRAAVLKALERWNEARADYDRALELRPGNPTMLRNREEAAERASAAGSAGGIGRWLPGFKRKPKV